MNTGFLHPSSFNLQTFFEKFDLFADAPDAVSKMRELVLEWATTGQLCHSDSAEWNDGVLGDVIELISGQHLLAHEHNTEGRGIPYLTGPSDFGERSPIPTRWTEQPKVTANPGDILITVKGSGVGKTNVLVAQQTAISRQLMAIRVTSADPEFVHIVLKRAAEHFQNAKTGIAIPGIGRREVLGLKVVLPPLAEQKRIVAKVDELMALCDRLEAQQQERETRHAALARASLARFADAPTPANLHFLFHSSFNIQPSDLRKSILTLAVQGKLVPQDPNEGTGAELLRVLMHGEQKPDNEELSVTETDDSDEEALKFPIPTSWTVALLGQIYESSFYGPRFSKEEYVKESGIPTIRTTDMTSNGQIVLRDPPQVRVEDQRKLALYALRSNDLLLTRSGTIGMMAVFKGDYLAIPSAYLIRFRFPQEVIADFYYLYLSSPFGHDMLGLSLRSIGVPNVNAKSISKFPAPLPPLAEQRRIVVKVEQLMALVDELESQLASSRATAAKLLEALVAELTTQA